MLAQVCFCVGLGDGSTTPLSKTLGFHYVSMRGFTWSSSSLATKDSRTPRGTSASRIETFLYN